MGMDVESVMVVRNEMSMMAVTIRAIDMRAERVRATVKTMAVARSGEWHG